MKLVDGPVVLRADRGAAARWVAVSGAAVAVFAWIALDSGGHVLALVALTGAAVVTASFLLQLVAPRLIQVRLDDEGVHARLLWSLADVPWERIHVAKVTTTAGEPVLELHVRRRSATGDPWRTEVRTVWLPVGADLDRLHAALEQRLGRADAGRPSTVPPPQPD